ncbi:MAG: hypothetical protein II260_04420 [Muribaculaceae bacterium]|nr:hypothetical protein [Muribaculaceae bacterium]
MKKILLLLTASFITITVNAQWLKPRYYPADELKEEEAYYANHYTKGSEYFICWSNESDIKIGTQTGIFDYSDNEVTVIVGFYIGNKLEEKVTTIFFVPSGDPNIAYSTSYGTPENLGEKIINHIKHKGKVRFLVPKYSGSDFDLTVPMNKNLKITVSNKE